MALRNLQWASCQYNFGSLIPPLQEKPELSYSHMYFFGTGMQGRLIKRPYNYPNWAPLMATRTTHYKIPRTKKISILKSGVMCHYCCGNASSLRFLMTVNPAGKFGAKQLSQHILRFCSAKILVLLIDIREQLLRLSSQCRQSPQQPRCISRQREGVFLRQCLTGKQLF